VEKQNFDHIRWLTQITNVADHAQSFPSMMNDSWFHLKIINFKSIYC